MPKKRKVQMKKDFITKKCFRRPNYNMVFSFQYIQEELKQTTIHGMSYILDSRIHFVERIFWIISFGASITFMTILLSAQYTRFIKSPTVMSVEMNYFDWNISFPAITLCSPIKINASLYQRHLNETSSRAGHNTNTFLWAIMASDMTTLDVTRLDIPENVSSVLHPKDFSKLARKVFRDFPAHSLTTNTNRYISVEATMTEMGMCHVINSNVAVYHNPLNWQKANQGYARNNIDLGVYEHDFLAQITNYTDVYKVYIHHPDEVILSNSPSFTYDVQGILTLGLSVWSTRISNEIRSLSIAMRKCRFVNEPLNSRYPVYSYNHCILECRIRIMLQLCGCVPHYYKPLRSERVCSISDLKCIRAYKRDILLIKLPKGLERFWYSKKLPSSPKDCGCLSNCEYDVYRKDQENFTSDAYIGRIQIGITSFPKIRVVRDIIFKTNDILLRSGGVVNLFIGSSIISLIELLVIMIKLFIVMLATLRKYVPSFTALRSKISPYFWSTEGMTV